MPSLASKFILWQPIRHTPRRLWVTCVECRYGTLNEDRHLRGWQESVNAPRVYRCAECAATDAG